jgi:hypothetical protein
MMTRMLDDDGQGSLRRLFGSHGVIEHVGVCEGEPRRAWVLFASREAARAATNAGGHRCAPRVLMMSVFMNGEEES